MDYYDITIISNAFVFFVICPIFIFIWDLCHYIYRDKIVEREISSEENSITPLEEIQSETETVSENAEGSENRNNDSHSEEQGNGGQNIRYHENEDNQQSGRDLSGTNQLEESKPSEKLQPHGEPGTPPEETARPSEQSEAEGEASLDQSHGKSRHVTTKAESTSSELPHSESGHGTSPREESTSFERPQGESSSLGTSQGGSSLGASPREASTSFEQSQGATSSNHSEGATSSNYSHESFSPSQDGPGSGIKSGEASISSSGRAHGDIIEGFSPLDVLDSSRIDSNSENKENDNVADSISPIYTVNRHRGIPRVTSRSRYGRRTSEEASPRRTCIEINSIMENKLNKLEQYSKKWKSFKEKHACQRIKDALQEYQNFKLLETFISFQYYVKECIKDEDNFGRTIDSKYLNKNWWKIHKTLEKLEVEFKSLDCLLLKKQSQPEKKKNSGEISATSSLLKETQSWTEKKKIRSPNSDQDQGRSRIPRSMGQQGPSPGSRTSNSDRCYERPGR